MSDKFSPVIYNPFTFIHQKKDISKKFGEIRTNKHEILLQNTHLSIFHKINCLCINYEELAWPGILLTFDLSTICWAAWIGHLKKCNLRQIRQGT